MADNTTYTFNPRNIVTKTTAYTAVFTDDLINVTGTTTITLPAISKLSANGHGNKAFKIVNTGTATVLVAPNRDATLSEDATLDTVNGSTTGVYLYNTNDYIVISADITTHDWKLRDPEVRYTGNNVADSTLTGKKMATGISHNACIVNIGTTTTANNIFSASTAPCALTVTGIVVMSKDTYANEITIQNGTTTVATVTKSTTVNVCTTGAVSNNSVASGATFTITGNATGTCMAMIYYTQP